MGALVLINPQEQGNNHPYQRSKKRHQILGSREVPNCLGYRPIHPWLVHAAYLGHP